MPPGTDHVAIEVMRNYGLAGLVVFIVLLACLSLIFIVIKMGDKHLTAANVAMLDTTSKFSETVLHIKAEHRQEREKWYEQYERIADMHDKASLYNREEHGKIMGLLAELEVTMRSK